MAEPLDPRVRPTEPTFYFVGVTTAQSSSRRMFPGWMAELDRPEVTLVGLDFPIHADPAAYRAAVLAIRQHPLALGAIVTTHKLDLVAACRDLIDELEPDAALLREVSSLAKRGDRLVGRATDPSACGLSLRALLPPNHFGLTGAHALCFGAGGSAAALLLNFLRAGEPADRPHRLTFVDRSQVRLDYLARLVQDSADTVPVDLVCSADAGEHDALVSDLPPRSLVFNATGMGKDTPGSPLTDAVCFPANAYVWDFNYRGELLFLEQARRQQAARGLVIEDGWRYFLHGWSQVIAHVLDITITQAQLERLAAIAAATR